MVFELLYSAVVSCPDRNWLTCGQPIVLNHELIIISVQSLVEKTRERKKADIFCEWLRGLMKGTRGFGSGLGTQYYALYVEFYVDLGVE